MRIENVGSLALDALTDELTDEVNHCTPVEFVESVRTLRKGETANPGPFSYDITPYWREPLNKLDPRDPAREINIAKGVQVAYTTAMLESGILYVAGHLKSVGSAYATVDITLSDIRVENNILPMLQACGVKIQSADVNSTRKTGKKKEIIQWEGSGFLIPLGAQSPGKLRQHAIPIIFKDEIDGWPAMVKRGNDLGDPDKLTDNRAKGFWPRRKIVRGSSPGIRGASRIDKHFLRGDQRRYHVRCIRCGFSQEIRWSGKNEETGKDFGFAWDMEYGSLLPESVRYHCKNCHQDHYEHHKTQLFATENGAEWVATARSVEPHIYSYHIPSFLSPIGAFPWSGCVAQYLKGYDPVKKKVIDIVEYRSVYNDIFGRSFEEVGGGKIKFQAVSFHRRREYVLGQLPNEFAVEYAGGPALLVTCTVDVHKLFLQVNVTGWTRGTCCFLTEYLRFEDDSKNGCGDLTSPAWAEVRKIIDEWECTADDGKKYHINITLIDTGWKRDTVVEFCSEYMDREYDRCVYPIRGVGGQQVKRANITEFKPFLTRGGIQAFSLNTDYYKDRMQTVLRRQWTKDAGDQDKHHFNAPIDLPDKALKELTVEYKREKRDERTGEVSYYWHNPGPRNELWDLLGYSHAAVEIFAWRLCIVMMDGEVVEWGAVWDCLEGLTMDGQGKLFE